MAYAYMKIDLDDIDTSDLIDALERNYLNTREQERLLDLIKDSSYGVDAEKVKFFLKVMDKYSMQDLHDLFKEDYSTVSSHNQLALLFKEASK